MNNSELSKISKGNGQHTTHEIERVFNSIQDWSAQYEEGDLRVTKPDGKIKTITIGANPVRLPASNALSALAHEALNGPSRD